MNTSFRMKKRLGGGQQNAAAQFDEVDLEYPTIGPPRKELEVSSSLTKCLMKAKLILLDSSGWSFWSTCE